MQFETLHCPSCFGPADVSLRFDELLSSRADAAWCIVDCASCGSATPKSFDAGDVECRACGASAVAYHSKTLRMVFSKSKFVEPRHVANEYRVEHVCCRCGEHWTEDLRTEFVKGDGLA